MARIAEDLLLTLLDNESAQPPLQRSPLGRVLAAALIAVTIGYLVYRKMTRGDDTAGRGIAAFAGEA